MVDPSLVLTTPVFTTPRLVAQSLGSADWPHFQQLQQSPDVMRFVRDIESDTALALRFQQQLAVQAPSLNVSVRLAHNQQFAGLAGFWLDDGHRKAEIGFMLQPELQGQGLGSELVAALIQQAFAIPTVHKLIARVTAGNEGSRRVLTKQGFVQEGCLRADYWLDGRWCDDWLFGLLRHEYQLETKAP